MSPLSGREETSGHASGLGRQGSELASGKASVSATGKRECPPISSELQGQVWEGGGSQGSAGKTQGNCLTAATAFLHADGVNAVLPTVLLSKGSVIITDSGNSGIRGACHLLLFSFVEC